MYKQFDTLNDVLEDRSVIIMPGDGETISFNGGRVTLKITSDQTKDQLGLYEIALAPGVVGAQLHYHRYMDEIFMVSKGEMTIDLGGKTIRATEGSIVYAPRYTPHGFRNDSGQEAVIKLLFNPGQSREGFFRGLGEILNSDPVDPVKFLQLYQKYDSYPVDNKNFIPVRS
ncbi:MAG: cupin domain-containing protein [Chitinophagaceae bacterium]|nr:cupin domain-containing protein [Chitinophagaceae bacterium]